MTGLWIRMTVGGILAGGFSFMAIWMTKVLILSHCPENKWVNVVVIVTFVFLAAREIRDLMIVWNNREIRK